jgi:hypothetical protein
MLQTTLHLTPRRSQKKPLQPFLQRYTKARLVRDAAALLLSVSDFHMILPEALQITESLTTPHRSLIPAKVNYIST